MAAFGEEGSQDAFPYVGARDNLTVCLSDLGFLVPSSDEGERWPYELIVDADAMPDFAVQSLQMSEAGNACSIK